MRKPSRKNFKSLTVDTSAMCDVAMLLLCFFVFTARFDQWEPIKIKSPAVDSRDFTTKDNLAIIYVSGEKVMFQIVDDSVRKMTLIEMSKMYNMNFSQDEKSKFIMSPIIGASICDLKKYDDQYMDWLSNIDRPGIPFQKDDNELFDWIKQARLSSRVIANHSLYILIKADENVKYNVLKQVIATLQKQKLNKLTLLLASKSDDSLN